VPDGDKAGVCLGARHSNGPLHGAIPVYGDGLQVRDWVHVVGNSRAPLKVLEKGRAGTTYHIGGVEPRTNFSVLRRLLQVLQKPEALLTRIADQPGHDRRHALDFSRISGELGWYSKIAFEKGLRMTIEWYEPNPKSIALAPSGEFQGHYHRVYGRRAAANYTD